MGTILKGRFPITYHFDLQKRGWQAYSVANGTSAFRYFMYIALKRLIKTSYLNYIHTCGISKGLYSLGDMTVIGGRIGCRGPILPPILSPITLLVWPIYWATGRPIAGLPPSPGDWVTSDLYQSCLIFHRQLVAR